MYEHRNEYRIQRVAIDVTIGTTLGHQRQSHIQST